ncbi:MAG: hypothetical protein P1P84_08745 [Deferrisomatales bacterium]|nr:hypothetical protein [Deferrisomatales bacterium]
MHRLLGRFPRIDDDTVTLIEEVLGEKALPVAEDILWCVLGDSHSQESKGESRKDGGEIAAALAVVKKECSREGPHRVFERLRQAVHERRRSLAYRGQSESERGLSALQKVFGLDAG